MPEMIGTLLNERYRLDAEIGRGGMGDVYRATDTQTGEPVAVKALNPGVVARDPDILERFIREGQALRQLNHPNIVSMVAAIEEEGQHYLIMEYIGGGSLQDLLAAQGPLPIARAVEIGLEVADALTRAHHLGIIHRDLKPANVLLAKDGTPRLTDFGIAHVPESPRLTQTGILMGTVDYLSPEACSGEALDTRADIWAFGVVLYEMLIGERPFTGKTLTAKLTAILTQPVPDLGLLCPDVPDALADLVYRTLEKDRHQRIPSVRLVGAELEAILKGWEVVTPARLAPAESRFATPTPPADVPRHNLPAQPTPFVGREAELTELARLLTDPDVRLLTILGAGGMGKTRLALEAGEAQLDNFEHGVYFVSLAPLRSVDAIVPTVAEALGFSSYEGGEPRQQLLDYLRQKDMLILMDNFEHLLDGVDLVTDILKTAPGVEILPTSRARLNVQREQLFHLGGMDVPDWETPEDAAQYSAVKLFLQSARRVQPGFELRADDLKYISRICRLVGGMPLGILLAAAWVEILSPEEIAAEISQGLDFLETDLRDVPERQRSVRAVLDHSWNVLTEREREVFQALSVFRGGFSRQAAQQVTGATLRELMALVNKSLLHRMPTGRHEMHELLQQYAEEKLNQSPAAGEAARDRHCAYYTAALQRWEADLKGPRQKTALAEIEADSENARAAWTWAAERRDVKRLEQAIEGLCLFYEWQGCYQDGEAACRAVAEKLMVTVSGEGSVLSPSTALRTSADGTSVAEGLRVLAKDLAWQSSFDLGLGRVELASQLVRQSLDILEGPELAGQDTRPERALALHRMGEIALESDREKAQRLFEQSLTLYRSVGDRWATARVLQRLGGVALQLSNYDETKQLYEESLAIRQALGDRREVAESLRRLAEVAGRQGQLGEAECLARESVAVCREIGDQVGLAEG
ncbi:MAG: protein kinase, partial [Chloroflexi bacterium]|nr:protein kinase [Chloroflexota bacterium]